jgi:hypothetical protein
VADEKSQISVVLNPQQLQLYSEIDPALPTILVKAALAVNRQEYWFAMTQGTYGFLLALAVIGGAVYLAMNGHDWVAGTMLGAGAVGMVTGFQISRLTGTTKRSLPGQPKTTTSKSTQEDTKHA